ncbi:MAG: S41 family peptidase [bacterium]|nr:S41 family peptidase [bacterium]
MKTKRTLRILLISWLIFSFLCVGAGIKSRVYADELSENARLLGAVLGLIHKFYVDEIKLKEIVYPAIKEIVNRLDPHSHFLTPEEVRKREEENKDVKEYAGVGMIIGFQQSQRLLKETIKTNNGFDINQVPIEIKKIFDNSPAQKSGLASKDEIVAINGIPVKEIGAEEIAKAARPEEKLGLKLTETVKRILGPPGDSVTLTIKRNDWPAPKDFVIIRAKIQIKNVEWKIVSHSGKPFDSAQGKRFGYLAIHGFSAESTTKEVQKALKEFKNKKVGGAIIDLRNNPGGRLDYCVEVLEKFLPPNTLVISAKGKAVDESHYTGKLYSNYFSLPLVILINEGSASASEIVAGVLRDYKRAILVGEKTYGKGSVQGVWPLPDGSALALTISKYFLPGGECIHEKGIPPHIEVGTEFDEPIMSEALKLLNEWDKYKKKFLK